MKQVKLLVTIVLLAGVSVSAAPCGGSGSVTGQEHAHLMVDIQPLERALNFQFDKRQILKRQVRGQHPGLEVELVFEKPIYNKWALTDRLMKLEPVTDADRQRLGNYADWDRRVNLRQEDNKITIYALDQEDAKQLTRLVLQHLKAMIAGEIQWNENRLAVLQERINVLDAYLQEVAERKRSVVNGYAIRKFKGMAVEDIRKIALDVQRELINAEVDMAALKEKARKLNFNSGRTDAQRDRYDEMKAEADAELSAAEERVKALSGKLRDLKQYIEAIERTDEYQTDIEDMERIVNKVTSSVNQYQQRLSPDSNLVQPQIVGDTVTIYEVEVVELAGRRNGF